MCSSDLIKAVFDSWRMQGGKKENFLSQLQKNQEVKNILLEESPWLLEATTEAEQQARIATLFDLNNLSNNNMTTLIKLQELQNADGAWSWYKGMPGSRSMTGYITELLVRLPLLTNNSFLFLGERGGMVELFLADRKSTRLNSSHANESRMPSSA